VTGLVIFSTFMLEFNYVFNSIWRSYLYGLFSLLLLNIVLLQVIAGLVTVLLIYLLLQRHDAHWQWRAFLSGASAGGWMFLFCLFKAEQYGLDFW
jgi:hypothetical protein